MRLRLILSAALALSIAALPRSVRAQAQPSEQRLTAHEWGTFTSIAGKDGRAAEWLPLTGSTDLPEFVEHFESALFKAGVRGTVRMETPVLYFYTDHETTVSVHVSFSQGFITEWYPHANRVEPVLNRTQLVAFLENRENRPTRPGGSISWDSVKLEPGSRAEFPLENRANRYYAARETSSTPLQIRSPAGDQTEKFLFYRGVASFSVPVSAIPGRDGRILAENLTAQQIPAMILFERRGDRLGFRIVNPAETKTILESPELNGTMASLKQAVEDILIAQGLYLDEARAMFETWRDSWFEEGSRLLYIVPREFVDEVLPLSIAPAPAKTVRVFVGRLELITPATQKAVQQALAAHDRATLAHYGRFLSPILETILADEKNATAQAQLRRYVREYYGRL